MKFYSGLAQLVEPLTVNQVVVGPSPTTGASSGDVAQQIRAPDLHSGGRGFESHLLHHIRRC